MSAATVPVTGDVAELIGTAAERVENRSLLLDKFVFHKKWPVVEEQTRRGRDFVKWDEASRWSFMRIADGAGQILRREAAEKRRKADGRDVEHANRERYNAEAKIAETLAGLKWDNNELSALRSSHTRRFISLFRTAYGERSSIIMGQLEGRLAINLADSLIQNAGICLDRLFGLPFIPGSAVKGVCRHTALEELKATKGIEQESLFERFRAIFGTADNDFTQGGLKPFRHLLNQRSLDQKGAISFLPAYPVNDAKIVVDLTNVHFPDYYRSGRTEDLSKENPRPNPFPAVEVGAQFAFCLVLNGVNTDPGLLQAAERWLGAAITIRGLGAKTAAGYGWFSLKPEVLEEIEMAEKNERDKAEAKASAVAQAEAARIAEEERVSSLSPESAATETLISLTPEQFAAFAKELGEKTVTEQSAFIALLSSDKDKRDRWKTWKKKKPEIAQAVETVRAQLNLPPLP
jgi:CRISPR-associated protein Cmr6